MATSKPMSRKLFKRSLFGYRRRAVNAHLAAVDQTMAELRAEVPAEARHDLVLRATRRSVENVMARAHADAAVIRAKAQTEAINTPPPSAE